MQFAVGRSFLAAPMAVHAILFSTDNGRKNLLGKNHTSRPSGDQTTPSCEICPATLDFLRLFWTYNGILALEWLPRSLQAPSGPSGIRPSCTANARGTAIVIASSFSLLSLEWNAIQAEFNGILVGTLLQAVGENMKAATAFTVLSKSQCGFRAYLPYLLTVPFIIQQ